MLIFTLLYYLKKKKGKKEKSVANVIGLLVADSIMGTFSKLWERYFWIFAEHSETSFKKC